MQKTATLSPSSSCSIVSVAKGIRGWVSRHPFLTLGIVGASLSSVFLMAPKKFQTKISNFFKPYWLRSENRCGEDKKKNEKEKKPGSGEPSSSSSRQHPPGPSKKEKEVEEEVGEVTSSTAASASASSSRKRKGTEMLKELGYEFKQRKLVQIDNGLPFEFEVKKGNKAFNQKNYERIGEAVEEYVFEILETEAGLKKITIPKDPKNGEGCGFFFASPGAFKQEKLLVIIHGTGVVKAGQWSRRLIINESLDRGTQLPYIAKGKERGFGIVVFNTNQRFPPDDPESTKRIRGSGDSVEHALYVWKNWIEESSASKIVIVAHSAGGYDTVKLAENFPTSFIDRVMGVCLTDSAHMPGMGDGWRVMKERGLNWVTSPKELGTLLDVPRNKRQTSVRCMVVLGALKHEETSPAAIDSVFAFIDGKVKEWEKKEKEEKNSQQPSSSSSSPKE